MEEAQALKVKHWNFLAPETRGSTKHRGGGKTRPLRPVKKTPEDQPKPPPGSGRGSAQTVEAAEPRVPRTKWSKLQRPLPAPNGELILMSRPLLLLALIPS